jgi:hypothetical protein
VVREITHPTARWYLRQAEFMAFPEDGWVLWLPVEMVVGAMGGA